MRVLTTDDVAPLGALPRPLLDEMYEAGCRVLESEQALADAGSNVVAALLNGGNQFYQWEHYPAGDVFCPISHAQYYYHSHPPDVRGNTWGEEHGHFHTFLRPAGFPPDGVRRQGDTSVHHQPLGDRRGLVRRAGGRAVA
jgi:hypothetical protein